jgi:N-acetyl-1-D-myo-inositol-2-amino-2-deoxy-alpha-D-glucopyranoside deacetylase
VAEQSRLDVLELERLAQERVGEQVDLADGQVIGRPRTDLGPAWDIPKIYWTATSESRMREGLRRLRDSGDTTAFEGWDPDGQLPAFVVPDELITTVIDGHGHVDAKIAAMKAHPTQIDVDGPFFALSDNVGNTIWAVESYRIAKGKVQAGEPGGLETDLFAGVA